jgi:hypothetical protein
MFATEFLIAVASYVRGATDVEGLEDAAATSIVEGDIAAAGMAGAVMLGIAELDRGDITEAELRERLAALSPDWMPSPVSTMSAAQTVTVHEDEAEIIVPAWVAKRPAGAFA